MNRVMSIVHRSKTEFMLGPGSGVYVFGSFPERVPTLVSQSGK